MLTPYCPDDVVKAYTGEEGNKNLDSNPVTVWPSQCGVLKGFRGTLDANGKVSTFVVNGHYTGGGDSTRLYYDGHPGIDFSTNGAKSPVLAAAAGTVVCVSLRIADGADMDRVEPDGRTTPCTEGKTSGEIKIDHGNGFSTVYLHLSRAEVHAGDIITEQEIQNGKIIGYSGKTGTGAIHLHFEVRNNGIPVDPYGWLGPGTDPYTKATNNILWIDSQRGILIRAKGGSHVFWYQNGKRYWVTSLDILNKMCNPDCIPGWGTNRIIEFPAEVINGISRGPDFILRRVGDCPTFRPDNTPCKSTGLLIRQKGKAEVYEVTTGNYDGGFRHIELEECQQRNCWPDVIEVTESIISLFRIQIGAPLDKGYNLVIHMLLNPITLADISGNCTFPEYPYVKHYDASMTAPEWVTSLEPFKIYWVKAGGTCTATISGILQGGYILVFDKGQGWYGITSRKSWLDLKGSCSLASGETSLWLRRGDLGWFKFPTDQRMNGFSGLAVKVSGNCQTAGITSLSSSIPLQNYLLTESLSSYKKIPAPLLTSLSTLPENQTTELRIESVLATPNPVKSGNYIEFHVKGIGIQYTRVEIFDLSGRRLFDSSFLEGNTVLWFLQDAQAKQISNGIYLYAVSVRSPLGDIRHAKVKKMVVLR